MHQLSLGELVRQALLHTGCDPALICELDDHATVQIDINDGPALFVGSQDARVMIWSDLCEFHDSIVRLRSEALLEELMLGFPYSSNKQLVLRESENQLQMYTDVATDCLENVDMMAEAINAFFCSQTRLLEIIRQ